MSEETEKWNIWNFKLNATITPRLLLSGYAKLLFHQ